MQTCKKQRDHTHLHCRMEDCTLLGKQIEGPGIRQKSKIGKDNVTHLPWPAFQFLGEKKGLILNKILENKFILLSG